jgi:tetratricopeptide (TPR) repeat protein
MRPRWANSFFFRATPLRMTTRDRWLATWLAPGGPLKDCWEALQTEELDEARHCFSAARASNDPNPYYGLGLTELAACNIAQAEWNARVAVWISDRDPRVAARFSFALGDVLAQRGDLAGAVHQYEQALARLNRTGPIQSDAGGATTGYTWFVFNREAIVDRLLPGVVWVTVTDDVAERMLQLGTWYERLGQVEDAACTYRDLLGAAPDLTEAEERLHVLESRNETD